jgi:hypothetical protein
VEPNWVFLDVSFYWKEVRVDKVVGFSVLIGFGIQPNKGSSRRSRTEIQQDGPGLLLAAIRV